MPPRKGSSLRKRVEGEFAEDGASIAKLVETLMKSFLRAESDYGAIVDIKTDVNYIYRLVKSYIADEGLDVYALKLEDRILISKTNIGFDEICDIIRERAQLEMKKGIIEIWDDRENKILHLVIIPMRKHFPIEYTTEVEKKRTLDALLSEYVTT